MSALDAYTEGAAMPSSIVTALTEGQFRALEAALGRALPRPVAAMLSPNAPCTTIEAGKQAPQEGAQEGTEGAGISVATQHQAPYLADLALTSDHDKLEQVSKYVQAFIGDYFGHFQDNKNLILAEFAEKNITKYMDGLVQIAKAVSTRPAQTIVNVGNEFSLAGKLYNIRNEKRREVIEHEST